MIIRPRVRPLRGGFFLCYGDGVRGTGIGISGAYTDWLMRHLSGRTMAHRLGLHREE